MNRIDPGHFKTLASGEPIEARLPYGDPFMIRNYAKLIFNVNRLDNTNIEHTHGFIRRILIIPFTKTIPDYKQDKNLHKKILEDKAGILNWMIDGAKSVIKNEGILESDECRKFKSTFIKESDSVALYLENEGYIKSDLETVLLSKLYEEYKLFCVNDGYTKLGKKNFAKRIEALGYERVKAAHNKDAFRLGKSPYQFIN